MTPLVAVAEPGFEPGITDSESVAVPLGHSAMCKCLSFYAAPKVLASHLLVLQAYAPLPAMPGGESLANRAIWRYQRVCLLQNQWLESCRATRTRSTGTTRTEAITSDGFTAGRP